MVKGYWAYRFAFFGAVALAVGLVLFTISSGQWDSSRDGAARPPRTSAPAAAAREPATNRDRGSAAEAAGPQSIIPPSLGPQPIGPQPIPARVQITSVAPLRREVHIHNLGDAAEDVGGWQLARTYPREGEPFTFPLGTVLLPGEEVIVAAGAGPDLPGVLYWQPPDGRVALDPGADAVSLLDGTGAEVSRFAYTRR
jgi:hypothetical protein